MFGTRETAHASSLSYRVSISDQTVLAHAQHDRFPLDPEAAATVAALAASVRGAGQPGTTPEECTVLDAAFFADLYEVRCPAAVVLFGLIH